MIKWSDQPRKSNPCEVRIVRIPAMKPMEPELTNNLLMISPNLKGIEWKVGWLVVVVMVVSTSSLHCVVNNLTGAPSQQRPEKFFCENLLKILQLFLHKLLKMLQLSLHKLLKILQLSLHKLLKIDLLCGSFSSFFCTFREAGFPVNARRLRLKENIKIFEALANLKLGQI